MTSSNQRHPTNEVAPQLEQPKKIENHILWGGGLSGFMASSVSVYDIIFKNSDKNLEGMLLFLPMVVFAAGCFVFMGAVISAIEKLVQKSLYKKSIWVTLVSCIFAVLVIVYLSAYVLYAGKAIEQAALMHRIFSGLIFLYICVGIYLIPGILVGLLFKPKNQKS